MTFEISFQNVVLWNTDNWLSSCTVLQSVNIFSDLLKSMNDSFYIRKPIWLLVSYTSMKTLTDNWESMSDSLCIDVLSLWKCFRIYRFLMNLRVNLWKAILSSVKLWFMFDLWKSMNENYNMFMEIYENPCKYL